MPGHMNVLLAEAEVPYERAFEFEMGDSNGEFSHADVVLVLGANDALNPAAKDRNRRAPACLSWRFTRPGP